MLDGDDIVKLPFGIGESSRQRMQAMPAARAEDTRVTEDGGSPENFVTPFVGTNTLYSSRHPQHIEPWVTQYVVHITLYPVMLNYAHLIIHIRHPCCKN